jgi:hypothetical protein
MLLESEEEKRNRKIEANIEARWSVVFGGCCAFSLFVMGLIVFILDIDSKIALPVAAFSSILIGYIVANNRKYPPKD